MTRLLRQLPKILRLRPAIPFTKRMHIIHIAQDDRNLATKFGRQQAFQETGMHEPAMNIRHARLDVLAELKLMSSSIDFDGAKLPRPIVNILEQMAMDGAEVCEIKGSVWDITPSPLSDIAALGPGPGLLHR